jgi:hypothetical protein
MSLLQRIRIKKYLLQLFLYDIQIELSALSIVVGVIA